MLIQPILEDEADPVMGARPSFPYFSEKILTWLTSIRVPCRDSSTGFRAIRGSIADMIKVYGICNCGTFVLEAARLGARVTSVSISVHERDGPRHVQTRHLQQFFIILWDVMRFW